MPTRGTDRVSDVYAGAALTAVFQRHLRSRVHWTCRQVRGPRVLDIGCSQGIVSILLGREGFEVVGIDIEPQVIEQATATLADEPKAVQSKVWFVQGDVFTADLELGRFDTVIAGEVMEHLVQPARLARRAHELLAEDGLFIATVPFGVHPHPDHKTTFYLTTLLDALGDGFLPEAMELIHTFVGSGTPVPVIGIVARKVSPAAPADPARLTAWLKFSDRAFAASEQRYLALIEFYETERTNLTDQLNKRKEAQAELTGTAEEMRKQLSALQREGAGFEKELARRLAEVEQKRAQEAQDGQARLAAAEQARVNLQQQAAAEAADWQARLAQADQQAAALAQEWLRKLDAAEAERARADGEWQQRLTTAEGQRAAVEVELRAHLASLQEEQARLLHQADRLRTREQQLQAELRSAADAQAALARQATAEAAEWQARLAETDQRAAALAQEWLQKLDAAEAERARAEGEWQGRLAAAEQAQAALAQQAAAEAAQWQARLAEADQRAAALAQEWLQKLDAAESRQAETQREFTARLTAAMQESGNREQEWGRQMRATERKHAAALQDLETRLAAAEQSRAQAQTALTAAENLISEIRQQREALAAILGEAEPAAQDLARERDLLRQDLTAWVALEQRLRHALSERNQAVRFLARRVALMEDATSYRIGLLIVRAAQRPYRLVLLPYRILALLVAGLRRRLRNRRAKPEPRQAPLPRPLTPEPEPISRRSPVAPVSTAILARLRQVGATGGVSPALLRPPTPPALTPAAGPAPSPVPAAPAPVEVKAPALQLPPPPKLTLPDGPVRGLDLHVAAILDEFSWLCYRYECDLMKLTPDTWRDLFAAQPPDFLFVESAWRGNDHLWGPLVEYNRRQPYPRLTELVRWCSDHGVPTVFWNKEDPVHNAYFMEAARLFDFVFTTDANCLPRYREALGHDRVYSLAFAAQPMVHNPQAVAGGRKYDLAFAGSWYLEGHGERRSGAEIVLRPALKHGVHIYDRNFGRTVQSELYQWPPEFHSHLVGGVPYEEMLAVYRQYKVFLNINSVTDSPTMFSRRVFELLACGTPVVSAYALGIEAMLGSDVVPMARTPEETDLLLRRLFEDDAYREEVADRGVRAVMSAHTYGHRLQQVIETLGQAGRAVAPVTRPRSPGQPVTPQEPRRVSIPPRAPGLCLPPPPKAVAPPPMVRRPNLVVGTIMDDVFEPCWRHECQLVQFTPDNWKEVLARAKPSFLFVDSAWRGNGETWRFHLQKVVKGVPQEPSAAFKELLAWCRKHGVPTVFWNREDPPNYPHFVNAAKLCDYVFTTDSDCLPQYREDCGHARLGVLAFAAQPWVHNPIASPVGRIYDINFAGTWYARKHPERVLQMETILRPALAYGAHIYDRMLFWHKTDSYIYPEEYRPQIVGSLSYEEALAIMKLYRVSLNVNSVIESPTMCSCRVFEGLMAGSAVISGYARGIENLLGRDLVPMPETPEETVRWIEAYLGDDDLRERTVHLAQRKILTEHTYSHRLDEVLHALGMEEFVREGKRPLVSALAVVATLAQAEAVIESFAAQDYPAKELTLVPLGPAVEAAAVEGRFGALGLPPAVARALRVPEGLDPGECLERALRASAGAYVTLLSPGDQYGPRFLSDLMRAREYTDADIVGKGAFHARPPSQEVPLLCHPEKMHRHEASVLPSALTASRATFDRVPIAALARGQGEEFFAHCQAAGVRCYSADRFNYMASLGDAARARPGLAPPEPPAEARVVGSGLAAEEVIL